MMVCHTYYIFFVALYTRILHDCGQCLKTRSSYEDVSRFGISISIRGETFRLEEKEYDVRKILIHILRKWQVTMGGRRKWPMGMSIAALVLGVLTLQFLPANS